MPLARYSLLPHLCSYPGSALPRPPDQESNPSFSKPILFSCFIWSPLISGILWPLTWQAVRCKKTLVPDYGRKQGWERDGNELICAWKCSHRSALTLLWWPQYCVTITRPLVHRAARCFIEKCFLKKLLRALKHGFLPVLCCFSLGLGNSRFFWRHESNCAGFRRREKWCIINCI